jgi:putative membrane protein
MQGFIVRIAVTVFGLWVASQLVAGVAISEPETFVLAAILLGVVNALVRPVVVLLTLPLTMLTLGLFLFVINAAMLGLVARLLPAFHVADFWAALLGSLILSIVSGLASRFIGPRGRIERDVVR